MTLFHLYRLYDFKLNWNMTVIGE